MPESEPKGSTTTPTVTQRMIAERAGVSQVTVSRALKNDLRLKPETRERIQQLAQEMGYRSNPYVASLMSTLRDRRPRDQGTTIAYLTSVPRSELKGIFFYQRFLTGAAERAKELGYHLEPFYLHDHPITDERLEHVLKTRSIYGLLVANGPLECKLNWANYAIVRISQDHLQIPTHCADNDQVAAMDLALSEIRQKGYRRIGLAYANIAQRFPLRRYEMAYRLHLAELPESDHVPIFNPEHLEEKTVLDWYHRNQPEVILTNNYHVVTWLRKAGLDTPQDFQFVLLDLDPEDQGEIAGVLQNYEAVAAAAIDLLDGQLRHNERGLPRWPRQTIIEGLWRDGSSLVRRT